MFLVGVRERVGHTGFRVNDEGAINGCPEPRDVGVPEKGALLLNQGELVAERLPGLDRALCHVGGPVRPARQPLTDPVPGRMPIMSSSSPSYTNHHTYNKYRNIPVDCGVVRRQIGDTNDDTIVFLSVNDGAGVHFVNGDDLLGVAQLRHPLRLHLYFHPSTRTSLNHLLLIS